MTKYEIELSSGIYIATSPFALFRLLKQFPTYRAWQSQDDEVSIEFETNEAIANVKIALHTVFGLNFVKSDYSDNNSTVLIGKCH